MTNQKKDLPRVLDAAGHLLLDMPEPDERTWPGHPHWWPMHGRNYGRVHLASGKVHISRAGPGKAGKYTSMHLTPAEAEELASMLLAAAHRGRNQE